MSAFMTQLATMVVALLRSALRIAALCALAFVSAALLTAAFDNGPADAMQNLKTPDVSTITLPPG
ncbi:MAG: hypothetical protein N4A53_03930 [Pelagimonas sp.]|nr:hypothetical protein [Pelagimonas sp.]